MKTLILSVFLLITNIYNAYSIETKIIHNIQNEIITNIDIKNEFKYLSVLNSNLKELDKETIFNISNQSIIREKIKKIEVLKNFKDLRIEDEYLNQLLKNIYLRLKLKSIDEFSNYLKNYNLSLTSIKKKLIIDALWNQLIVIKYKNQITIDEEKIKEKIRSNTNDKEKEYELSEIIFEIKNKNEIQTKYNQILKNIDESGFENSASLYSFSDSAKIGGDIGWVKEKSISKKIKSNIKNLDVGEISKPIILSNGVLLLKIRNIRNSTIKIDFEVELTKAINFEKNRQLSQYSKIYFNKIKKNLEFNE